MICQSRRLIVKKTEHSLHFWSALCFPLSIGYESSADVAPEFVARR